MADSFDPYHRWLSIPKDEQPPNHYRLLGLGVFEDDLDVIDSAADRQMSHVRTFQTGQRSELSQRILNEISVARVCLLNAERKAAYDSELRVSISAPVAPILPEPVAATPQPPEPLQPFEKVHSRRRSKKRKNPVAKIIGGGIGGILITICILWYGLGLSGSNSKEVSPRQNESPTYGPSTPQRPKPKTGKPPTDELSRLADYAAAIRLQGDGKPGLLLTGRRDHVVAPNVRFDEYDAFTIEAWIYGGWRGAILCQGLSGDPRNSVWLSPGPANVAGVEARAYGWESGAGKNHEDAIDDPLPAQWNHLALVFDGVQQLMFVNGKRSKGQPAPKPGPLNHERPLIVGGFETEDGNRFSSGLLRSIRISQRAVYAADFEPTPLLEADAETILLYDFEQDSKWMSSQRVIDFSGNENTGKLKNAWWVDPDSESR